MRGRSGNVDVARLEKGDRDGEESGAVAGRGMIGREVDISVGRAGRGLTVASSWSSSGLGWFFMMGGSVTRGTIVLFCRRW